MPRLRLVALAAALAAAAPAAARADEARPGELVVGQRGKAVPKVVELAPGASVRRAARRWEHRPGVTYAVPNVVAHAAQVSPDPNDPGRSRQPGGWQALQWNFLPVGFGIDAPAAWAHAAANGHPGARGVTIAVLDTGVAYEDRGRFRRSPDFDRTRFVPGYDFVDGDRHPDDRNGHGTHVAGTIAESTNNGIAVTGLAYEASIMPVRVLDSRGDGDATDIARGVRFAVRHHADIVNLSLEFSTDVRSRDIPQLLDALRYAHRKGVLVVAATGNEARGRIAYPAAAPAVVAVAATTEHGCLSDFSNDGRGLDLVAPGGGADAEIPGDPDCRPLEPPGHDILQMTFVGGSVRRFGLPSGYEGTSMAVPHVSGTAALVIASGVLGRHPSPNAIERRLKATARDLGAPGWDRRYGAGLLDAGAATDPAVTSSG